MSMMNDEKMQEFDDLAKPMIKFLCENFHPHVTVIITPTSAEITEGVMAFTTNEFVKD